MQRLRTRRQHLARLVQECLEPIGSWQAVFNGNGFNITALEGWHGLFDRIGDNGVVKNVDLMGAKITPNEGGRRGALAAINDGAIVGCYVTGELTFCSSESNASLGGIVGANRGTIAASVADVDVKVTAIPAGLIMRVGGFVGVNYGHILTGGLTLTAMS